MTGSDGGYNPLRIPQVRFGKGVDTGATPPVHHRNVRIITRRRVYLFGLSWGNR